MYIFGHTQVIQIKFKTDEIITSVIYQFDLIANSTDAAQLIL